MPANKIGIPGKSGWAGGMIHSVSDSDGFELTVEH